MRKQQFAPISIPRQRKIAYLVLLAVILLFFLMITGVFGGSSRSMAASKLRCMATQDVTPFGNSVLYYDGMTLYCLSPNGAEKWYYPLGENASFSCSDQVIAAWSGTQLHIIGRDGIATYNDNMADEIQFAKVGSRYVGVVLGSGVSPSLIIKDMQGTTVDSETDAYVDMIILDLDFFSNGEYLWTTSMNVYGVTPTTIMHTMRVNMSNSGEISLGENLTYGIVYAGSKLHVVSTQHLRLYDYRGTQDTDGTVLVYGWQMIDHAVSGNSATMLFAPSRQIENTISFNQLRLLSGKTDKRFTLPSACLGASLYNNKIYAIAENALYRADINGKRFSAISLPASMNGAPITNYLGMLNNGVALVACDSDVYAITLP